MRGSPGVELTEAVLDPGVVPGFFHQFGALHASKLNAGFGQLVTDEAGCFSTLSQAQLPLSFRLAQYVLKVRLIKVGQLWGQASSRSVQGGSAAQARCP